MMKEARWREALLEMMGARGGPDWGRAGAAAILLDRISRAKDALGAAMWTLWACVIFSFAAALPAWWMFTMRSSELSARGVGLGALSLGWIVLWAFFAFRAVGMAKFAFGGKAAATLAALAGACACAGFAWVWDQAEAGVAALRPWSQWGGVALAGSLLGTIALNKTLDAWLGAQARSWLALEWRAWLQHLASQGVNFDAAMPQGLPQKTWPMKPEHLEWRAMAAAREGLGGGRPSVALGWIEARAAQGKLRAPELGLETLSTAALEDFCLSWLGSKTLAERERLILEEGLTPEAGVRGASARL